MALFFSLKCKIYFYFINIKIFTPVIEFVDIINYIGDFKRLLVEGSQTMNCNHIVEFGCTENSSNLIRIVAMCLKTSDLNGKPDEVNYDVIIL